MELLTEANMPKSKLVRSGNIKITYCRPTKVTARKSHKTFTETRHPKENKSKATCKLERTQSNEHQTKTNTERPQTMKGTQHNRATATEPPP